MEEERNVTALNDPHHSTADLLSWSDSEIRLPNHSSAANRSNQVFFFSRRELIVLCDSASIPFWLSHLFQPSDGMSEVLGGGGQITNAEAESLNKK